MQNKLCKEWDKSDNNHRREMFFKHLGFNEQVQTAFWNNWKAAFYAFRNFVLPTLCLVVVFGCSSIIQTLTTTRSGTNIVTQTTTAKSFTLFDGRNSIDKLRVTNGKTQSIGVTGETTETTSTNLIRSLELIQSIVKP